LAWLDLDGVFTRGHYEGSTVEEVWDDDPDYMDLLLSRKNADGKPLRPKLTQDDIEAIIEQTGLEAPEEDEDE